MEPVLSRGIGVAAHNPAFLLQRLGTAVKPRRLILLAPLGAWRPPHTGQRGRPRAYADVAIETGHLLRLAFGRPWWQTEGLLRSITTLLGIDVGVPDHTTFFRRSPGLALAASLAYAQASGPVHVVIDATGLRACGTGEWLVAELLPKRQIIGKVDRHYRPLDTDRSRRP